MALTPDQLQALLAASVAPVIVISGAGLLVLSMTNRYGRVIDRARHLARDRGPDAEARQVARQLGIVWQRAQVLRRCITLASLSILLVVATVLSVFATRLLGWEHDVSSVWLFGAALVLLIASLVDFLRDLQLSLAALRLELGKDV